MKKNGASFKKPLIQEMNREPDQMTPEELGQLFPIILSDPNPDWNKCFESEKKKIEKTLGSDNIIRIEHIGSTAVAGMISKPTIDILVEIPENTDNHKLIEKVKSIGYYFIPRQENPAPHMMFTKGYTKDGFKGQAFHIHVRYSGDWDELYFRDYLRQHPKTAMEYAKLKMDLAEKYRHDREGYTNAKTDFINRITEIARKKD